MPLLGDGANMSSGWFLRSRFKSGHELTGEGMSCELIIRVDPLQHKQVLLDEELSAYFSHFQKVLT